MQVPIKASVDDMNKAVAKLDATKTDKSKLTITGNRDDILKTGTSNTFSTAITGGEFNDFKDGANYEITDADYDHRDIAYLAANSATGKVIVSNPPTNKMTLPVDDILEINSKTEATGIYS